jgi:hypothetical protein
MTSLVGIGLGMGVIANAEVASARPTNVVAALRINVMKTPV